MRKQPCTNEWPNICLSPDDPKINTGYNSEYEKYRKDDTLCYSRQKLQSLTCSYHRFPVHR